MATLNDVISCYNELVDEVNGHTASIDALTASLASINTDDIIKRIDAKTDLQTFTTAMAALTAKLETRLSQVEARLDELVQEHDVMMDTISSLLAAPAPTAEATVELKRVEKKPTAVAVIEDTVDAQTVVEEPAPTLKRVEKKPTVVVVEEVEVQPAPAPKPTVEEQPTVEEKPAPALKRAPAPSTKTAAKTKTVVDSAIQKRALARQYMVEHGAKVEDLRNPERINETIASDEFTAWMNAR